MTANVSFILLRFLQERNVLIVDHHVKKMYIYWNFRLGQISPRGSYAREAYVGQNPILIEYGQPLFVWFSRD